MRQSRQGLHAPWNPCFAVMSQVKTRGIQRYLQCQTGVLRLAQIFNPQSDWFRIRRLGLQLKVPAHVFAGGVMIVFGLEYQPQKVFGSRKMAFRVQAQDLSDACFRAAQVIQVVLSHCLVQVDLRIKPLRVRFDQRIADLYRSFPISRLEIRPRQQQIGWK